MTDPAIEARPLETDDAGTFSASTAARAPQRFSKTMLAGLGLLAVAVIASYLNSFNGVFLFDDQSAIVDNMSIRRLGNIAAIFSPPPDTSVSGRPIVNASFALNFALGGLDPWGYHAINLLIHLGAAWLLFGIVRRALRGPNLADRFGTHADGLALSIALLWAVHPLQTESVTYLVQRAESLGGLVYLAALYTFIRFLTTPTKQSWGWTTIGLCALGMLCKETLATAPFVLLACDLLLFSRESAIETIRRRGPWYAGLFATILIAVAIFLAGPRGASAGFGHENLAAPLEYAASEPGVILHYLRLAFWPTPLCLDYDWPIATSASAIALPALVVATMLLAVCAAALKRRPEAFVGIWFFMILLPTSSFIPVADLAFEHRMYLPLAGVIALVVLGAYRIVDRTLVSAGAKQVGRAGLGLIAATCAVGLGVGTIDRNRDYASAAGMWENVLSQRPENPRALLNRACEYERLGRMDAALAGYRKALAASPNDAQALNNLGNLLTKLGKPDEGLQLLERATGIAADRADYQYSLGSALSHLGRDAEAAQAYRRSLELDQAQADVWYNLGNIDLRRKDYDGAATHYAEALRVDPDHVGANFNLGGILQLRGRQREADEHLAHAFTSAMRRGRDMLYADRPVEAVETFQAATRARPNDADAHIELAKALDASENPEAALSEAREAVRLAPSMPEARALLDALQNAHESAGKP